MSKDRRDGIIGTLILLAIFGGVGSCIQHDRNACVEAGGEPHRVGECLRPGTVIEANP